MSRTTNWKPTFMALSIVFLAALALPRPEATAAPVKIRIAHSLAPAHLTPLLFQKKEILKNYGKTYEVQLIYVPNTSAQIPMLARRSTSPRRPTPASRPPSRTRSSTSGSSWTSSPTGSRGTSPRIGP